MDMETPRARVMAAADRQPSAHVPFSWGFGPTAEAGESLRAHLRGQGVSWDKLRLATDDVWSVDSFWVGGGLEPGVDIWGIARREVSYGGGSYQEISRCPLAGMTTVAELNAYAWPDPGAFDDARTREQLLRLDPNRSHAIRVAGGNPFEIYCWMTGLEEAMVNLALAPDLVVAGLEKITGFFEERMGLLLGAVSDLADLVFLADDLGGQTGLLISRKTYVEILQPFHKRLSATVHAAGPHLRTLFHTDGSVFAVLPDLIDAGMDILEAVQTDAALMDPAGLKDAYGGRIAFHGGVSVQKTLPFGTAADVRRECRYLIDTLGRGGGLIAAPAHAIQHGTPPANVLAMLEEVLGEERLRMALEASKL